MCLYIYTSDGSSVVFASQKLPWAAKDALSGLLAAQKVAQNAKNCHKVAEHNLYSPSLLLSMIMRTEKTLACSLIVEGFFPGRFRISVAGFALYCRMTR